MIRTANARRLRDDKLVIVWRFPNGKIYRMGKRVALSCPLTHEECRAYVTAGPTAAVRLIALRLDCSLSKALYLLNKARGPDQIAPHLRPRRIP
jgi:hypothetical protein